VGEDHTSRLGNNFFHVSAYLVKMTSTSVAAPILPISLTTRTWMKPYRAAIVPVNVDAAASSGDMPASIFLLKLLMEHEISCGDSVVAQRVV
jgi:hypothetical protein